jgi:signal transduction histidine kinase
VREAIRAGGAGAIIINLVQNPDGLEMSVCDDGLGGIGSAPCVLRMMAHRARAIGATLETAGDPGAAPGARVVCRLPSP